MKIKLDENIPATLVDILISMGHDVDTVHIEKLNGKSDSNVWEAVQATGRFLITQDLDFSDIRIYSPGTHHVLLLVRLHEPGRLVIIERVKSIFQKENIRDFNGSFMVATEYKLRILMPSN